jgi:hypothetical protein
MSVFLSNRRLPVSLRYAPLATEIARHCNMSRFFYTAAKLSSMAISYWNGDFANKPFRAPVK